MQAKSKTVFQSEKGNYQNIGHIFQFYQIRTQRYYQTGFQIDKRPFQELFDSYCLNLKTQV